MSASNPITPPAAPSSASNRAKIMTLTAAFLGWLFDGFEMGIFPLIGPAALKDMLGANTAVDGWFGVIIATFLVGAATGGVLFGWLGDKLGRVRAMSLSILTYAIFTGLCGFASEPWQIAGLRFIASLGMGGEWSLGVALVNEIWPGKSRAIIAGLIGAAANVGYLLAAVLSLMTLSFVEGMSNLMLGAGLSQSFVDYMLGNDAWRFIMISGALPAFLVFMVRLYVPESEKWTHERDRGATSHWATKDLLVVLGGAVVALFIIWSWSPAGKEAGVHWALATLITVAGLAGALYCYLFPVKEYLRRAEVAKTIADRRSGHTLRSMVFGSGLAAVALLGTWGSTQWAPKWAMQMAPDVPAAQTTAANPAEPGAEGEKPVVKKRHAKEWTLIWLSIGAIVGTMLAAITAGKYGRRFTYTLLCGLSIVSVLILYQTNKEYNNYFLFCTFLAGALTASFYGFFPLYLPELFPTAVRATGQGFAFNFGRIIAAVGVLQTANLTAAFNGSFPMAGSVLASIYVIGMFIVWIGPETIGKELPE